MRQLLSSPTWFDSVGKAAELTLFPTLEQCLSGLFTDVLSVWWFEVGPVIRICCSTYEVVYCSKVGLWGLQFDANCCCCGVRLSVTPWTAACQASLSVTISQSLLRPIH